MVVGLLYLLMVFDSSFGVSIECCVIGCIHGKSVRDRLVHYRFQEVTIFVWSLLNLDFIHVDTGTVELVDASICLILQFDYPVIVAD